MTRVVGIKDVAERAGVSITTVSHALNGKGRISPQTRQHVNKVAKQLGYHPNATARNLAGGRSGLIGLAVGQAGEGNFAASDYAYYAELVGAASFAALDCGYSLVTASAVQIEAWKRLPIDGAIIVDPLKRDPLIEHVRRTGTPLVTAGRVPGAKHGHWVDSDHHAVTRASLDHLAARGAQRIALLESLPTTSYAVDSHAAYEDWCAERGRPVITMVAREDLTEGAGYEATVKLLRRRRPPDAVHSTLERVGLGALLAAQALGLSVPRDLMVSGVADSEASKLARPGMTTVELHPERIGVEMIRIVAALIEGRDPEPSQVHVPSRIVLRGSTKRPVLAPAAQTS